MSALARDTHKFESRYLDGLVGPYPADKAVYDERSPIHHLDGFDRPLILFQGLDDSIVPPNQSEMVVDRSEEHTSELQSLMRITYAVFCLKKQNTIHKSY